MDPISYEIIDNKTFKQFEIHIDGAEARMTYFLSGDDIIFQHTYVPKELEGRGIGSALVRGAFQHAEQMGRKVIIYCPFTLGWLARHPEYKQQLNAGIHTKSIDNDQQH